MKYTLKRLAFTLLPLALLYGCRLPAPAASVQWSFPATNTLTVNDGVVSWTATEIKTVPNQTAYTRPGLVDYSQLMTANSTYPGINATYYPTGGVTCSNWVYRDFQATNYFRYTNANGFYLFPTNQYYVLLGKDGTNLWSGMMGGGTLSAINFGTVYGGTNYFDSLTNYGAPRMNFPLLSTTYADWSPTPKKKKKIVIEGDSITDTSYPAWSSFNWPFYAQSLPWFKDAYFITNFAQAGSRLDGSTNWYAPANVDTNGALTAQPGGSSLSCFLRYPTYIAPLKPAADEDGYLFLMIGRNSDTNTAAQWIERWKAYTARAHDDGWKIVAMTITPMNQPTVNLGNDSAREYINNALRSLENKPNRNDRYWDYLIDLDTVFTDPEDLTLLGDGLHPGERASFRIAGYVNARMMSGSPIDYVTRPAPWRWTTNNMPAIGQRLYFPWVQPIQWSLGHHKIAVTNSPEYGSPQGLAIFKDMLVCNQYIDANKAGEVRFRVPFGLGFTNIITRLVVTCQAGDGSNQTNTWALFTASGQTALAGTNYLTGSTAVSYLATNLTSLEYRTVWLTNSFPTDAGPRELILGVGNYNGTTAPTNTVWLVGGTFYGY